jgi:monoamine oxidase
MTDTEGKVFRLKNGMLGIVRALIEKYDLEIQFNQKVTCIESSDLGFKVHATSQLYTAENVVVTSSLTSFQNIQLPSQIHQKLETYLTFGGYGKCIKGYFILKEGLLSTNFEDYILTDEPFRIIKHSATVFEWYLLSLTKVWEHTEVCERLNAYFGQADIKEIVIQDYNDSRFNGCYWVYNKGFFHKIYELKNTVQLGPNFYAIGEHFSSNPNWIEGSLESVENLLLVIDSH